jgi:hypothetical protein
VLIAERFGQWPWAIDDEPADRVAYYMAIMSAEAVAHQDHAGLDGDETIIRM